MITLTIFKLYHKQYKSLEDLYFYKVDFQPPLLNSSRLKRLSI